MKKLISVILLITLAVTMFAAPSFAAKEAEEHQLNMTFNDIETNQVSVDGLTIKGGKAVVEVTDKANKGLHLKNHVSETSVIARGVQASGIDVVYSIDIMADNLPVNLTFGTAVTESGASGSDTRFFQVKDNSVITHDGKMVGAVGGNGYTTITIVSKKIKVCDYYINGRKVLSNWSLPKASLGLYVAVRQPAGSSCYIDNLRCYKGSGIDKSMGVAPFLNERVDVIGQQDFTGDVTFFDNRFCFTSGNPQYRRVTMVPKSNEIIATRLIDYQSPARTNYMYLKRKRNIDDCYFDVDLSIMATAHPGDFKHRYLKMEGDFKADKLQDIQFLVRDNKTTGASIDTGINITLDGAVSGGGVKAFDVVKHGEWFHLLWAMNLDTMKYDVYVDGKKVLADINLNANMGQFNMLRVNLNYSRVAGDLYIDNFDVTGLIKPIIDSVETKTCVIPTDDNIIEFMSDKIGMHAYGNLLHKNGVKTELETKGIYDKRTEQYYVTADTLNKAFDLNLTEENEEITGDITVNKDGTVALKNGAGFKLEYAPKVENGRMYVPVRQFAADAVGKHVWWFETGILLFSNYEVNIDTSDWIYQSMRDNSSATGCTVWNDIDYLNGYLQYIRPGAERLKADYIATTGDATFTQHPRLYHTAADFAMMKEKFDSNADPIFTSGIKEHITEADKYLKEGPTDYTMWSDSMRHQAGMQMGYRFKAWGYAYYMTGEQKYVDAAFEQFEKAATFPDFNTSHVIDAGEAAASLAIGYDWFYNAFTPEQRELALKVTREQSLDVLASGLYGRLTSSSGGAIEWRSFKLMSNYNAINNAGITLAALATLEYDPDSSFRYIKDSARSIEYTMQMFPPGGAWTEGPQYLSFTLRYMVPWASNMEKNFGRSYNIMDGQGMEEIVDFLIACSGTEGTNNMGDGEWSQRLSYESYFYFANRFNKPYASYIRWQDLQSGNSTPSFYDLVYYDFDAGNIDPAVLESVSKMQRIDGMELFSIRDSYNNSDFYFSAHFGTTTGYHQHWDCGTFALDLLGNRWAYDLGTEDYNLQNELGYQGYEIFRKRGEAHNMLVINPTKYSSGVETVLGEFAPIIDAQSNKYGGYVYADMSSVYEDASGMNLGYYIDDNMSSVTMRNEFTLKTARNCMWTMITKGDIDIDGNIAYVSQNNGAIKVEFICSGANARWEDNGNPKPLPETIPADRFAKQKQNMDYRQLRLLFDAPEGENKIVVKISPMGKAIKAIEDIPFSEWKLPEKSELAESVNTNFKVLYNGKEVDSTLPVYDEVMPEIEIVTEDSNAIVEVDYARDINDKTRIKVWDPNRITYQMGTVSYYKASGVSMGEFKTIPIYNVEVSSTPEEANRKENMLDDDLTTRWTAMAKGEYAIFDLGSVTSVEGIAICFYKGTVRQYYFDVYVSDDGQNWRSAYMDGTSRGDTEELEAYGFEKREETRYIKIVGKGNSGNPPSDVNFNVLEFRALTRKY